jgi:cytochrome c-type biogenesis protein CcmF
LLFWSFVLSIFIAVFTRMASRRLSGAQAALAALVLTIGLVFFLIPVVFITNPFERLWQLTNGLLVESALAPAGAGLIVPVDGQGMNPSLRHPAMLSHPPALYIGLVGLFIPFAFAFAAMAVNDKEHNWIKHVYPVVVFAWLLLTAGMFLGSWWAYTILGWGGYWGWDAVEIAGLLPWLLSFGLIHSMQMQMRGKNFTRWIYLFSGAIVFFILLGVLITRSGILESVHAYSVGVMGPVLSILILLNFIPFMYLFLKRGIHMVDETNGNSNTIAETLARMFNTALVVLVLICFIGQSFPLTSRLFAGEKISWTQGIYERLTAPIMLVILIITALFPLSDEKNGKVIRSATLAIIIAAISLLFPVFLLFTTSISLYGALGFWAADILILAWLVKLWSIARNKKPALIKSFSVGMVLIHVGLGLMAWGILGSENLSRQYDTSVDVGERVEIGGLTIEGQQRELTITQSRTEIYFFDVLVTEPDGTSELLTPDLEFFPKLNTLYARPAIDSDLSGDVQVIINEWESSLGSGVGIRVNVQPYISWLWIGGLVMGLGGALILFTGRTAYRSQKTK